MIPAIDIHIFTANNTLRHDLSMLLPDDRDSRVLNKEYELRVIDYSTTAGNLELPIPILLHASVKCVSKSDVLIILNNLISLAESNSLKIGEGSYLGIHYCGQVEDGRPIESCSIEKVWSN